VGPHCHRWICWKYVCFIALHPSLPISSTHPTFEEAFAATGWRVGWIIGPEALIKPTLAASTRIVFCSNAPLQEAAAAGLEQAEERKFFATQLNQYAERRKILTDAFDKLGMKYTLPEGSYFVLLVCFQRSLSYSRLFSPRIYLAFSFQMTTLSQRASKVGDAILGAIDEFEGHFCH
jgi:DNA-binding transcriptional MocR family regulator